MTMTIQYINEGRWTNLLGHDCCSEQEMHEYVSALGPNGLRVADDSTQGEVVRK